MQIQFSTTESCASQLLSTGLLFETVPGGTKLDPPDNQGGGSSPTPPPPEPTPEEPAPEAE